MSEKDTYLETFTAREAAVIAEAPLPTVQKAITTGELPAQRGVGGKRLLDERSVMALALVRLRPSAFNLGFREARSMLQLTELNEPVPLESGGALDLKSLLAPARNRLKLIVRGRELVEAARGRRRATIKGTQIKVDDLLEHIREGQSQDFLGAAYPSLDQTVLEAICLWANANPARGRPPARDVARYGVSPRFVDQWKRAPRITAAQIDSWAATREAQGDLPILVRKLIHAGTNPNAASMPGGDSISASGWDGVFQVEEGNAWVPSGRSAWELSCNANPASKASDDYLNRTSKTSKAERKKTTFVIVTARRWPGKERWLKEHRQSLDWKAVRVLDAVNIEEWLEQYPAVSIWFADTIGLTGHGVSSLAAFWADWAEQALPAISPEAIFKGRETTRTELTDAIEKRLSKATDGPIAVRADSTGEAGAFAVATLLIDPAMVNQGLTVTSAEGWRFVEQNPMIRVVIAAAPELAERVPRRSDLVVIIPFSAGDALAQYRGAAARQDVGQITLVRPDINEFESALVLIGVGESEAKRLAVATGRSWSFFRRRTSSNPALRDPAWLHVSQAQALTTICLLGTWSSGNKTDREIVATLSGRRTESVERDLKYLATLDDSPVIQIGDVWKVKSPLLLLDLISDQITSSELDRFFSLARDLLASPDPMLEVPENLRYAASIYGKVRAESSLLLKAVCDTLVKLSVRGPQTCLKSLNIEWRVESLVRELLNGANSVRWLSLSSELPALAEAAPQAFMDAVENSLKSPKPPIATLFSENAEAGVWGRCWHAGLLWALELLAWAPANLLRVSLILAALSRFEIKGNWGNTPKNSLMDIFRSWFPQTAASLHGRIQVLDELIKREEDVAFDLCDRLASTNHDTASPSYRPVWRDDDAGAGEVVTNKEHYEMLVAAADRQIRLAINHASRVSKLLDKIDQFDPPRVRQILALSAEFSGSGHSDIDREVIRNALREKIYWRRNFGESAKDGFKFLRPIEDLYRQLQPADLILRYRWLFASNWPNLPSKERDDYEEQSNRLAITRDSAVAEIFAAEGLDGILRLARDATETGYIGLSLAKLELDAEALAKWLVKEAADLGSADCIRGISIGLFRSPEEVYSRFVVSTTFAFAKGESWQVDRLARMLTLARDERFTWDLASQSDAMEESYWRQCTPGPWLWHQEEDIEFALNRLLDVSRPRTVLQLCRFKKNKIEQSFIFRALEGFARGEESDRKIDGWEIVKAVEKLEESKSIDRRRLAYLEFSLFASLGLDAAKAATSLYEEITADPTLFVELVAMAYRPRVSDEGSVTEQQRAGATHAWQLLRSCRRIPGTRNDGSVDEKELQRFVVTSRKLCERIDCLEAFDVAFGEILAHAPSDPDGLWPCGPVRDLLDEPDLDAMRRGFRIGIYNKRGVFSRAYAEGGLQERALGDGFRSHALALANSHVRLAATLDDVSKGYYADGVREDDRANLRKEGF